MSDEIKISQDSFIYRPKEQNVYPITEHDWKKMRKTLEECDSKSGISFKDIALLLIGGAVSGFLSLIALYNSEKVAVWVMNANWVVLVCSIVLGVGFLFLGYQQEKITSRDLKSILREMEDIESKYHTTPEKKEETKSDRYSRLRKTYYQE